MGGPEIVVRQNVWELGADWAAPILWYARGVKAMQARELTEPTSWGFYAAIHGIDGQRWRDLGYLKPTDQPPSAAVQRKFWQQCQHGSWYFLPWHRGYLQAFEATVRAAVVALGGPADWALPYWNYFKPGQSALPPAFASRSWPDGTDDNPLFVEARWGPRGDGQVFVPTQFVNLDALADPDFTGVTSGGSPGFGGVDTGFSHSGSVHGGIESQPHDFVHVLIGGADPNTDPDGPPRGGVMSDPDTAGLDPIFWLHHANIDRLWESWRQDPTHHDPTVATWLEGPAKIGQRAFVLPLPGGKTYTYTPGDVTDPEILGFRYDDLAPGPVVAGPQERLRRLGADASVEGVAVPGENVELVGANARPVPVSGDEARTTVRLDTQARDRVAANLSAAARSAGEITPDRVFLNLENVQGLSDAVALQVYVGLPGEADPRDHPDRLAGSVALFGVRRATSAEGEHGGAGLTFVLEISRIVDALHLDDALAVDDLDVRIVPVTPVPEQANVRIGRISVYRQGV